MYLACNRLDFFNTLKPIQYDCHFVYIIFKLLLFNKNCCMDNPMSLKYIPKDPIDNDAALFEKRALHAKDEKPLFESLMS